MRKEDKKLIENAVLQINEIITKEIHIMEVCGTHTHQIAKLGIRSLLNPKIKLISGPGCPVCVTEGAYIDGLISILQHDEVVVATFGDLLRVRGSLGSLEEQKSLGKSVITVYSPESVLSLAKTNKNKSVIFAAVGFETTAPIYAALIKSARQEGIKNLFLLTSLKRMEPAIRYILENTKTKIDGMLCPGHVAAVTGVSPFLPVTNEYKVPAVICGFDDIDIITSINILCRQVMGKDPVYFTNAYKTCVEDGGNMFALNLINEVFKITSATWRGIGIIEDSAFSLNDNYEDFDAARKFDISFNKNEGFFSENCECGKILIGEKTPDMCLNFGGACTPEHPLGPCMISSEGACAAFYRFGGGGLE